MNRLVALVGLFLFAFICGLVSVSFGESRGQAREISWIPTKVSNRLGQEKAKTYLANSKRWQIVDELRTEKNVTDSFSESYRLVAVVGTGQTYALLESINNEGGLAVSKVLVGDQLPNEWVVSEINTAAIVATRKEESQRVELFPSK